MSEMKWDGTTYGNGMMHRWLIALLRGTDIRVLYAFAYVFIVPPCIFRPGFRFIFRYFRQRFRYSLPRTLWNTYLNHCLFAQVVIDRFAMYAGKHFDFDIEGGDVFQRMAEQPAGFVMLSSHIGNYEIAGYSLIAKDKPINALVFSGEKVSVMKNRNKLFAHTNIKMISVREDMSHLFEINNALTQGEIVSFPADRILGSEKNIALPVLGQVAKLPEGPFRVITMRELEAVVVHVMKSASRRYRIFVTPLHYDKTVSRKQQIDTLAKAYVAEVERVLNLFPRQWYNYFDFWEEW